MSQADQASQEASAKKLIAMDITSESWREYSWIEPVSKERITYRIEGAVKVHLYRGCTTHRVEDAKGVVHCVPAIGFYGCVLRWSSKDPTKPVAW